MMLAEALDAMSRKADAIGELETAERSSPKEPMLHFELGYLYYTQHDYQGQLENSTSRSRSIPNMPSPTPIWAT